MVIINGYMGILLQLVGLSALGIGTLLLTIECTGVFNKPTNNKIHKKKLKHEKQWFFDVEEKNRLNDI